MPSTLKFCPRCWSGGRRSGRCPKACQKTVLVRVGSTQTRINVRQKSAGRTLSTLGILMHGTQPVEFSTAPVNLWIATVQKQPPGVRERSRRCPYGQFERKSPRRYWALGFSLRAAAISICDIPRMVNNWGTSSSSLIRRILGHKWCKSDAALAMEDLQIDGQYYVAASRSPSQEYLDAHSECDESRCRSKVEEGTYKTKHAPGCNKDSTSCPTHFCYGPPARGNGEGADDWLDPPDSPKFEQEMIRVTTAGGAVKAGETFDIGLVGIPIITWDEEKEEVAIAEYNEAKGLKPAYVAISHV